MILNFFQKSTIFTQVGGGNKRCARCFKRWSLDSGGWGKRGSQRGETVGRGKRKWYNIHWGKRGSQVERGKRNWYDILRAMVKSERQEAKVKHPALLWDKGQILGKRATSKAESENAISKIRIRDLEGSATRRRRALLPLDQHRSAAVGQMEGGDPSAKNVGEDLVFVVPLSSAGWNLNHHHWGRRKEFFSERIGQISVSQPTLALDNYWP